jgi:hypothetical protein
MTLRDQGSSSGKQSFTRPLISSIESCQRWTVWSPGPMFSIGLPFSGKVILKNLAICGSDWLALAKPLNGDAVGIVVTFGIWFCDDPAKTNPIY